MPHEPAAPSSGRYSLLRGRSGPPGATGGLCGWARHSILIGVTGGVCALTLGAFAPEASASCPLYTSQGNQIRVVGLGDDNGTRAYIEGSSTLSSCGTAGAFVSIEKDNVNGYPMIQTGYIKETSTYVSKCDHSGSGYTGVITEYTPDNLNYTCDDISSYPFGQGDLFSVSHTSPGWQTYWDGNPEETNVISSLGFGSGYARVRDELYWTSNLPTYLVNWGPSGQGSWDFKTNSSGCCLSYTPVQANQASPEYGDTQDGDNDWNVLTSAGTPPSPFYIQWTP